MKTRIFPLLLFLPFLLACSKKGQVEMTLSNHTLHLGDSLFVEAQVKNISSLIIDFGDSTTVSYATSGNLQTFHAAHVYSDTGIYIVGAFGFNDKSAYSDRQIIEVQP